MCAGCTHTGGQTLHLVKRLIYFPVRTLPINVVCFTVGLCENLYSVAGDCSTICSIL